MKKMIRISMFVLSILLITNMVSCKKDQLQPTSLWLKSEYLIFENLKVVHQNNLDKIKVARTTVGEFKWGDDVITINGPAAYEPLASHAEADFNIEYENSILKDTTKLDVNGMLAQLIDAYLDKCQKYEAGKAYDKMYVTIPKGLYEIYPRFWERFLTELQWYLTGPITGDNENNQGTRLLWVEKYMRSMLNEPDENFQDDWQQNLPANVYIHNYYLEIADGPDKSKSGQSVEANISVIQNVEAKVRYSYLSTKFSGSYDDCITHCDVEHGVYYLYIPVITKIK